MSAENNQALIDALQDMREDAEGIRLFVIEDILAKDYEDLEQHIAEVLEHGCVSGIVSSMIYHKDTHAFFKEHFEEVMEMAQEYTEDLGIQGLGYDIDQLAWLSYEETLRVIANELDLI